MIKFFSDLRQVGGFLRFPPPMKLTPTIYLKVAFNTITLTPSQNITNEINYCYTRVSIVFLIFKKSVINYERGINDGIATTSLRHRNLSVVIYATQTFRNS